MAKLKIGLVGCGAIGSSLAERIVRDFSGRARLVALYDLAFSKASRLSFTVCKSSRLVAATLKELIGRSDLVIEAASAQGAWQAAQSVLGQGKDILIMSVGGIAPHYASLVRLANNKHARVFIPSGAISGIDALKAARFGKIKEVMLTTRKSPQSFAGVAYLTQKKVDLKAIQKDTVLYCGTARRAIRLFPQNINVAALLSIAGIGLNKTKVKIIASPLVRSNIHEIKVTSEAGTVLTRTENVVHPDNPKTSYLAVLAAVATLQQILDPVKIGT